MATYLVCVFIALAIHRIWNYEDIFAAPRRWVRSVPMLACPACNAFWVTVPVAVAAQLLGRLDVVAAASLPLAAYPLLRFAVWVYAQPWEELITSAPPLPAPKPAEPPPAAAKAGPPAPQGAPPGAAKEGCTSCAEAKKARAQERARTDAFKQRVVVLADHSYIHAAAYAAALAAPDRLVQLWVPRDVRVAPLGSIEVRPVLASPSGPQELIGPQDIAAAAAPILDNLMWLGNATVIVFDDPGTGPLLQAAVQRLGTTRAFAWVIHLLARDQLPHRSLAPYHVIHNDTPMTQGEVAKAYGTHVDRIWQSRDDALKAARPIP